MAKANKLTAEELTIEQTETETVADVVEEIPVKTTTPNIYTVKNGDTWVSIAEENKPAGVNNYSYATALRNANIKKNLTKGTKITLL